MKYVGTRALAGALVIGLSCVPGVVHAQAAASSDKAAKAAKADPKDGASNYLKCDGRPNNMTSGETAARLLGAVTLLGLFAPAPEAADPRKRLFGEDGIAACDALLVKTGAGEGNLNRRMQLHLARAVHRIEAKDFAAARADVGGFETEYADRAGTLEYRLGTGLAVRQVEALALAGTGDYEKAADKALEIAEAAPYDLIAGVRAHDLVSLAGRYGDREKAFYGRMVKLMPLALLNRASARQIAHDFRGAAEDYDLLVAMLQSYSEKDEPDPIAAYSALAWYLAGDKAKGAEREATARAYVDKQVAAGKAVNETSELLDFAHLVKLADEGDLRQARLLFAGRTKWNSITPAALDYVGARLRKDAKAEDLIGLLAKEPGSFVREQRETRLGLVNAAGEKGEKRFAQLAPALTRASLDRFATQLWKPGKSPYLMKKPNEKTKSWTVNALRDGGGVESGYALLLASALAARSQGKTHFSLHPIRISLGVGSIRTGSPDGALMYEETSFEAATVIQDLSPLFPKPVAKK